MAALSEARRRVVQLSIDQRILAGFDSGLHIGCTMLLRTITWCTITMVPKARLICEEVSEVAEQGMQCSPYPDREGMWSDVLTAQDRPALEVSLGVVLMLARVSNEGVKARKACARECERFSSGSECSGARSLSVGTSAHHGMRSIWSLMSRSR